MIAVEVLIQSLERASMHTEHEVRIAVGTLCTIETLFQLTMLLLREVMVSGVERADSMRKDLMPSTAPVSARISTSPVLYAVADPV